VTSSDPVVRPLLGPAILLLTITVVSSQCMDVSEDIISGLGTATPAKCSPLDGRHGGGWEKGSLLWPLARLFQKSYLNAYILLLMSSTDEELTKITAEAAKELVKPVYQDAVQPLAKEIGKGLGTVGETINAAIMPLRLFIRCVDQIEEYVKETVAKKFRERNVPTERVITPAPDVAVPAMIAMRYSQLREEYATLLATAMDRETAHLAHPGFVEILKQLTPDEAKIIYFLPRKGLSEPVVDIVEDVPEAGRFTIVRNASMLAADAKCDCPQMVPTYIDNLQRLGLTNIPDGRGLHDSWRYDRVLQSPEVRTAFDKVRPGATGCAELRMIGLTDLGHAFREACWIRPNRPTK
jgi:Abortive infection alpha